MSLQAWFFKPGAIGRLRPCRPQLARHAIAELVAALPGLFSTIEHVGSTSVPGLAAKPIIDLMAATGDLDGVGAREGDLHLLGYGFTTPGMPGRLLYRRGPASARAHHLHVVQASTLPTRNQARAERGLPPAPMR